MCALPTSHGVLKALAQYLSNPKNILLENLKKKMVYRQVGFVVYFRCLVCHYYRCTKIEFNDVSLNL